MKKLETQTGFYRNGDIFSKIVCLPDNANESDWQLVSEEEYQQHLKEEEEHMQREMLNAPIYQNADRPR